MKYIDADKLRAEIERLVKLNKECAKAGGDRVFLEGITAGYADVLSFLDSIPEQPVSDDLEDELENYYGRIPDDKDTINAACHFAEWGAEHLRDSTKKISEDLEEAAEKWATTTHFEWPNQVPAGKKGFKAGAEWQKKQIPMPEDTVIFQKGVEEGKRLMMEGATYNELMELYMAIRDEIIKRHRDAAVNIKEKNMDLKEDTGNESALHQIRG